MTEKENIKTLIEKFLAGSDQFLVELKVSAGKIAVSIDKPAGITIAECVALSRHLNTELESTGLLTTHELEVGSPGMDEPLRVYQQYLRRIGRNVKVMDLSGAEHKGVLNAADEKGFSITETNKIKQGKKRIEEKTELNYTYDQIKEVKLILSF